MNTTTMEKLPETTARHRSVTLGALAALVAGIAVVLVLPTRQSYWPLPSDFLGPWPRWLPWFFCLRQALGAACLALVPVVLRRRVKAMAGCPGTLNSSLSVPRCRSWPIRSRPP